MSAYKPIHYVEVNVSGPHGDYPYSQVVVWVHRGEAARSYFSSHGKAHGFDPRRYVRGMVMLILLASQLWPGAFKSEVRHGRQARS